MTSGQVIIFILGTIVVLFGAYYVTYYIGMKASGQTHAGFRNKNIKLLDRYAIARDKQFCAIEVAGKVYIVGITNQSMTLLDTLDAAAFSKMTENNRDTIPWNETPVGRYGNKLTKKVVAFIAAKTGRAQPEGEKGQQKSGGSGGADFAANMEEAKRAANDEKSDASDGNQDAGKSEQSGKEEDKLPEKIPETPEES